MPNRDNVLAMGLDELTTPSFSFADANCIVDIEIKADQLLSYIDKVTALADRACVTAIRQTETAQILEKNRYTEISNLRKQLDQQKDEHQVQQLALLRVEHESNSRFASLETQLRQIGIRQRYGDKNKELQTLRSDKATLTRQLGKPVEIAKQRQESDQQHNHEIAELRLEVMKRDETIASKNRALKNIEIEYRSKLLELDQRLAIAESELQIKEDKLQKKETQIGATGLKEAALANLVKRLSAECETLNAELQDRNQRLRQIELKGVQSSRLSTIWRYLILRLQPGTK